MEDSLPCTTMEKVFEHKYVILFLWRMRLFRTVEEAPQVGCHKQVFLDKENEKE